MYKTYVYNLKKNRPPYWEENIDVDISQSTKLSSIVIKDLNHCNYFSASNP